MRPFGDISNDYSVLIQEIKNEHKMNQGQILQLICNYLLVHCPDSREEYVTGEYPIFKVKKDDFYYGPRKSGDNL